jgi:hypothetical protein
MPLTEQILLMTDGKFWAITSISIAVAVGGFYFAFYYLRRARIIEDTPTASVRSAHQGYVELAGSAAHMADEPIYAPLTHLPCCWYSYKVERLDDKKWHLADQGTSDDLFLLRDETGECIIDPEDADVTTDNKDVWYGSGSSAAPSINHKLPSSWQLMLKLGQTLSSDMSMGARYRYTEKRIHAGDQLYGLGLFKTLDEMDHIQHRSEISRELLREWKQDKSSLLFEFDRNRDGKIDQHEWEQVRRKAEEQARTEYQQLLDGSIIHTLSDTGSRTHPFLLSTLPEFDLARRFRKYVIFSVPSFFLGGGLAIWMLTLKLTN